MVADSRSLAAKFYDLNPRMPNDIPFYVERLPSPKSRVLELGCGTGRVAVPLASHCASVHGLDASEAMVKIGRRKVAAASLADRVRLETADITTLELPERFDFIIAPFRVLQNLASNSQVAGLLQGIRQHLAPDGRCILNTFMPHTDAEKIRTDWISDQETLLWEVDTPEGRVACFDRKPRLDTEPLVLYPELIYRRYAGPQIVEEAVLSIALRCYYPQDLTGLLESFGFEVLATWGGYNGERYGEGSELVVEFGI